MAGGVEVVTHGGMCVSGMCVSGVCLRGVSQGCLRGVCLRGNLRRQTVYLVDKLVCKRPTYMV